MTHATSTKNSQIFVLLEELHKMPRVYTMF